MEPVANSPSLDAVMNAAWDHIAKSKLLFEQQNDARYAAVACVFAYCETKSDAMNELRSFAQLHGIPAKADDELALAMRIMLKDVKDKKGKKASLYTRACRGLRAIGTEPHDAAAALKRMHGFRECARQHLPKRVSKSVNNAADAKASAKSPFRVIQGGKQKPEDERDEGLDDKPKRASGSSRHSKLVTDAELEAREKKARGKFRRADEVLGVKLPLHADLKDGLYVLVGTVTGRRMELRFVERAKNIRGVLPKLAKKLPKSD